MDSRTVPEKGFSLVNMLSEMSWMRTDGCGLVVRLSFFWG